MSDDAPIRWTAEDYALAMGELPALNAAHAEIARLRARVGALESALRAVCDSEADTTAPWCARCCLAWDDPHHDDRRWCHVGHALAVMRESTAVAGEKGAP